MSYDFDRVINRLGTNSVKWEFVFSGKGRAFGDHADPKHGRNQLLPLWVADMDFQVAPPIQEAVTAAAQHGIYGYSAPSPSYYEAAIAWMERHWGYSADPDWFAITPGVVPAINMMVETFVKPGEKVLIQRPVYYPFFSAIKNNGGEIVSNNLIYEDGVYRMDFDDLAEKAADPAVTMAILCSPHNPIGRVWSRDELAQFAQICMENNVLIVSDEIHCDLILPGHRFTSLATLGEEIYHQSIICTAPSKTFNLAGLKTSNIIIPDEGLRETYSQTLMRHGLLGSNTFGLVATEAAYRGGDDWLAALLDYLGENYRFMVDYLAEHLPQLKVIPTEGTYLVWVDFNALGMEPEARKQWMMEEVRLFLDEGEMFGEEGQGFERFNIACPRSTLKQALDRLKECVDAL